jgi:hypothetical protein
LPTLFSELSLEICKKISGSNLYINNLTGFEPNTPTSDYFLHFVFHAISELLPVLEDIIDCHIGNSIPDN